MHKVLLRADPRDGNDPFEASVGLPIIPRAGDTISVLSSAGGLGASEAFLKVTDVVLTLWDQRIEVWVELDGYDRDELRQVMRAADDTPAVNQGQESPS